MKRINMRSMCMACALLLLVLSACNNKNQDGPIDHVNGGGATTDNVKTAPPEVTFTLRPDGLPDAGYWKCDPVLFDTNGDGFMDIVAHVRLGEGPKIWLGDGGNTWREQDALSFGETSCGGGIDIGDVNEDGHPDIVIADHCRGMYVFFGDGAGNWELAIEKLVPDVLVNANPGQETRFIGAEDLCLGDTNKDGHLDIVAGSAEAAGIALYLGDGTGLNWTYQQCSLPSSDDWAVRVQVADINGDGYDDIAACCGKGPRVWLNDKQGDWLEASTGLPEPMLGGLFSGLKIIDMNADGRLDLVAGNDSDGPQIFWQQEDGTWVQGADVFKEMAGGCYGLDVADFNRDGHLDIICTGRFEFTVGYVYGAFLLLGDGAGNWHYVADSGLPPTALEVTWGACAGDFNADGIPDAIVASGGLVATDAKRKEPIIPTRLMAWEAHLPETDGR